MVFLFSYFQNFILNLGLFKLLPLQCSFNFIGCYICFFVGKNPDAWRRVNMVIKVASNIGLLVTIYYSILTRLYIGSRKKDQTISSNIFYWLRNLYMSRPPSPYSTNHLEVGLLCSVLVNSWHQFSPCWKGVYKVLRSNYAFCNHVLPFK